MHITKKLIILILFFLLFINCGDSNDTRGINFKLEISPKIISYNFADSTTLTDRLFIKLDFEYKLEDSYKKLDGKYMIFVHFTRKDQEKVFLKYDFSFDDVNIKNISKWEKGDIIKHTNKIYIPKFLDNYGINFEGYEMFDLSAGLFRIGSTKDKIVLFKKEIRIEAEESHMAAIGYMKGWHGIESNPSAKDRDFQKLRWTSKKADCIIDNKNYQVKNPDKYTLIIKGGIPKGILEDQKIIIKINNIEIDEFIPIGDIFTKEYKLKPMQMGNKSTFSLTFETDKTFIPSALDPKTTDNRELGMRIYSIYFRKSI